MGDRLVHPIDRAHPGSLVEKLTLQISNLAQDLHRGGVDPDTIVHALLNTVLAIAANTGLAPARVEENLRTMADNFQASVDQVFAHNRSRAN